MTWVGVAIVGIAGHERTARYDAVAFGSSMLERAHDHALPDPQPPVLPGNPCAGDIHDGPVEPVGHVGLTTLELGDEASGLDVVPNFQCLDVHRFISLASGLGGARCVRPARYMFSIIASPNSLHLSNVAPSISRSKSYVTRC